MVWLLDSMEGLHNSVILFLALSPILYGIPITTKTLYSALGKYTYEGKCPFAIEQFVDTMWTVNLTFDKDIESFQFYEAFNLSYHPHGRWICVTNLYLPSTDIQNMEFTATYSAIGEPSGECYVLKNNNTHCLDHDPGTTSTTTTSTTTTTPTTTTTTPTTITTTPTTTTTTSTATTTTPTTTTTTPTTTFSTGEFTSSTTDALQNVSSNTANPPPTTLSYSTTTSSTTSTVTTPASSTTTANLGESPIYTGTQHTSTVKSAKNTTVTQSTTRPTTSETTTHQAHSDTTTHKADLETTTQPSTLASTTATSLCRCNCEAVSTVSALASEEAVEQIIKELTIEKETLSSTQRAKTSAKDNRPSSTAIGVIGVAVVTCVFGPIVLLDMKLLFTQIKIKLG